MQAIEPTALFVNAQSRRGKAWYERVRAELDAGGIRPERVVMVRKGMDLGREVGKALEEGCRSILIGGGDGTLRIAAEAMTGSHATLGVIPLGTGNAFARDLGIRTDPVHAVEVIRGGAVMEVDVGTANGSIFLNAASAGLSALVAGRLAKASKAILGPIAYLLPVLQALRVVRPFEANLEVDGEPVSLSTYQIVVGNGRFHAGPFLLDPSANIRTGEFFVYAVTGQSRAALFRYAYALVLGRHGELSEVSTWHASRVRLRTRESRRVVLDGDLLERTPATFEVLPRALRVYVPGENDNRLSSGDRNFLTKGA